MHHHYRDIVDRIAEPPLWWDENAVPRYCEFAPNQVANIYATEVVLMEIECQNCGQRFMVAMSSDPYQSMDCGATLSDAIKDGSLHYGDPPNIGCCPAGPSMNCYDIRVVEYWHQDITRNDIDDWHRVAAMQIDLPGASEVE